MKNPLKPVFDFLAITGGEALLLLFLTGVSVSCLVWGGWGLNSSEWVHWKLILHNIPILCGLGTFVLTILTYIGCMHDSEKRGLFFCAVCSLLIHLGLFLVFADTIIGNRPVFEEQEVSLNLNTKPPVIVNDYYFTEMPGDEVLDGATPEPDSMPRFNNGPDVGGPTLQEPTEETLKNDLERTAAAQESMESEVEQNAESADEARLKAEEIQVSELVAPERKMTENESRNTQESFADLQKFGQNIKAGGLIGAENQPTNVNVPGSEIFSAESAQREKINLLEEARKKQQQKSDFRKKLEQNQIKPIPAKTTSTGSVPSTAERNGEHIVSGAAQNWGESSTEQKPGGRGEMLGEIRSGLGEERGPAAGAASLTVKTKKQKGRKIAVTDAPKDVTGGQTLGARAGEADDLNALLSGAVNGVSDAVLETSAKPEKFAGSNVLKTEKEEILKNITIFRFEEPSIPEMGLRPDSSDSKAQTLEELRKTIQALGGETGEDSESNDDSSPSMVQNTGDLRFLQPNDVMRPQPSLPYRQRMRRNHRQMIEEAGGNPASEQIVELGLQYLERNQFSDGHWSLNFLPNKCPEGISESELALGTIHADTAATGLSLLAFLGAGYTHLNSAVDGTSGETSASEYAKTINLGLNWLLKNQQPDGSLFSLPTDTDRYSRIYSHGIASIALCEAYGMTHDPKLREPAQRAIDFIVKAQTPLGGWRYTPEKNDGVWRGESDTSVSGWQAMALVSAKMAGLKVPNECFEKLNHWIQKASIDGGARFCYLPVEKPLNEEMKQWKKPSYAMTAEGLLMQLYLNYDPESPKFKEAVQFLMENLPTVTQSRRDTYYWYYATQVLFHLHDSRWKAWQTELVRSLQSSQELQNEFLHGSWKPLGPAPDYWGQVAGRHYVTTMHLLILEVYYRHLPLFRELNTEEENSKEN